MEYFNEIDPAACSVLRNVTGGHVDERSIKEVTPNDISKFRHAHFFAGAGLWSVAAKIAGWPATRPLWTASCPCQPFSVAGKGAGVDDPRHLWPDLFRLIRACRPPCVVGEQVAGASGYGWLDGVRADLEGEGYAVRAVDIPACAVDAPHQRQRLYWVAVADADHTLNRGDNGRLEGATSVDERTLAEEGRDGDAAGYAHANGGTMADADSRGRGGRPQDALGSAGRRDAAERADVELEHAASLGRGEGRPEHVVRSGRDAVADPDGASAVGNANSARADIDASSSRSWAAIGEPDGFGAVGDAFGARLEGQHWHGDEQRGPEPPRPVAAPNGSFWSDHEWLACADGKARRTKPGICMLVNGMAGRINLWRLAGNSIVPQLAAEVLKALMETNNG